jgi:hypothetical protein
LRCLVSSFPFEHIKEDDNEESSPGSFCVLPLKVIGSGDGQWDPDAWKDAFYGNPLSGFVAP